MRILYCVQRYGADIVGGSEAACRQFAEQLVRRGHQVEVVTSCAQNYSDWADSYEPGTQVLNGVVVHRLSVVAPRDQVLFGAAHRRLIESSGVGHSYEHHRWARLIGPDLVGYEKWLLDNYRRFDVAVFMTYMFTTTTLGLMTLAGLLPTVLQPTAHDEAVARASFFQYLFRLPDAFMFFTPEERQTVTDLYAIEPDGEVTGIGLEQWDNQSAIPSHAPGNGLVRGEYLACIGRLDRSKGVPELIKFFAQWKETRSSRLRLVLAGEKLVDLPSHPDVVVLGFLSEEDKHDVIENCLAMVQPSYFESFSIILCESWLHGRPALVQGNCNVLRGQAMRSNGAVPYRGYAEFAEALDWLDSHRELAGVVGEQGRSYVESSYQWPVVVSRVEMTLQRAIEIFARRPVHQQ